MMGPDDTLPNSFNHTFFAIPPIPQISFDPHNSSANRLIQDEPQLIKYKSSSKNQEQKNKESQASNPNNAKLTDHVQTPRKQEHFDLRIQDNNINQQSSINKKQQKINQTNKIQQENIPNFENFQSNPFADQNLEEKKQKKFDNYQNNPFADQNLEKKNELKHFNKFENNPFSSLELRPTNIIQENQQKQFLNIVKDAQQTQITKNNESNIIKNLMSNKSGLEDDKLSVQQLKYNAMKFQKVLMGSYTEYWQYHSKQDANRYATRTTRQSIMNPGPTFHAKRLSFKKKTQNNATVLNSLNYSIQQAKTVESWLHRMIRKDKKVYVYKIQEQDQLLIPSLKPTHVLNLPPYQHFSPFTQIQVSTSRLLVFSNSRQQILIFGLRTKELICRLPIQERRYNPILHLTKVKEQTVLLIIGGYKISNNSNIEGKKSIQMFLIDKQSIVLRQKMISLILGRIHPLVFGIGSTFEEQGIVILGGNSTAAYKNNKNGSIYKDLQEGKMDPNDLILQYDVYKDINESVNKTGLILNNTSLLQIINNYDQVINPITLSVKIEYPKYLYGGSAIFLKNKKSDNLRLFLPYLKRLHIIRFIKAEVHIEQTRQQFQTQQTIQTGTMKIYKNVKEHILIQIGQNGKLIIIPIEIAQGQQKKTRICKMCQCGCIIM